MPSINFYKPDLNDYLLTLHPFKEQQVNNSLALYLEHEGKASGEHALYVGDNGITELPQHWRVVYCVLSFFGFSDRTDKATINTAILQIAEYAVIKNMNLSQQNSLRITTHCFLDEASKNVKKALETLNEVNFTGPDALITVQGNRLRVIQNLRLENAYEQYKTRPRSWFNFSCGEQNNFPSNYNFGRSYYTVYGELDYFARHNKKTPPKTWETMRHFEAFLRLSQIDDENGVLDGVLIDGNHYRRFGDSRLSAEFIIHHKEYIHENHKQLCLKLLSWFGTDKITDDTPKEDAQFINDVQALKDELTKN